MQKAMYPWAWKLPPSKFKYYQLLQASTKTLEHCSSLNQNETKQVLHLSVLETLKNLCAKWGAWVEM